MDSKLTRQQVLDLYSGLRAVSSLKGAQFAYAIVKNFRKLSPVISSFKFSDGQKEYESKRSTILSEKQTPEGTTQKQLEYLEGEYKEVLKQTEEYLNEGVEVELYKIPLSYVPSDIDGKLIEPIMPIIKD